MKIEKLHIYGFGKHENLEVNVHDGINVFYGENEAGKSTIQQFILHILFGFPQRNSQLLRYEPRSNATYGGKIQILMDDASRVFIERVKGKASGDVTLYFEDGTRGGEKELATILNAYSRADYEAIFSFSLLQLQGFEKMTEEELTRTLLSSGTTGMDTLSSVEMQFAKEMGELYKPTGRKPFINQKMEEIRQLETAWKAQMDQVEKYEPSIQRLNEIESILKESVGREKELADQLQSYSHWKQLKPLKIAENELLEKLDKLPSHSFPPEGLRRYEAVKDKQTNTQIAVEQFKQELQSIAHSSEAIDPENLEEIQGFLSQESQWHQLRAKRVQLEEEHSKTLQQQMQELSLVGIDWKSSLNDIVTADVSIQQEDRLVTMLNQQEQLTQQFQQEERLLNLKMQDVEQLEKRLSESKRSRNSSKGQSNAKGILVSLVGFVLIVGLIFSFLASNWLIALLTVIISAGIYGGFTLLIKGLQKDNEAKQYTDLLEDELKSLKDQIMRLEGVISEIEHQKKECKRKIYAFLRTYQIDEELSPSLLPELFTRLRLIQNQQIQLDQMEGKLEEVSRNLRDLERRAQSLVKSQLVEDILFHQLREIYLKEKKRLEEEQSTLSKITKLQEKLNELELLLNAQEQQITTLFTEAGVSTESDFYQAHVVSQTRASLEKELEHVRMQLGDRKVNINDFEEGFEVTARETLEAMKEKSQFLLEEKATLLYETSRLLENEEQSQKLQQLEEKKSELYELVKKWAAYKTVTEAIKQTVLQLKEERLPDVLDKAKSYFRILTNESYELLEFTPEGLFEAVKPSGERFRIAELSQATKEQAYIALRIALAVSLKNRVAFPIILDDPFVHFDRNRLKQVVQLMKELQNEHQLLYFTCHEHMRLSWKEAHIIDVATLQVGSGGVLR
ncbi:AAA family ATPase [Psychrobacillus sp. BL-248-WT-3]|uniref:ATP-binding protein n=1 Tax=Psychrobacillus sp. BL-248-WT-3 TaxID=2725306 RepID=UPI00146D6E37|nr:AAA family ATPase [Psychrobacillus sp. BL-248-WT-3]NME07686.1 AAA family ATPase [Psychrobacillus sp. BL-248-WT-3]